VAGRSSSLHDRSVVETVQVDWADFSKQVGAFVSRAESEDWIANKLPEWLRRYERPPNPGGLQRPGNGSEGARAACAIRELWSGDRLDAIYAKGDGIGFDTYEAST
jgi:hypothetical protein